MKRHDSMRGYFAVELYKRMKTNDDIWLVVGDLGYKIFDNHFQDYPKRCINTGAAEQSMMGIAVGLALEGKIPFVYSITPFLLYRPFETIRNYIHNEKIPVKLIGSGRDDDYKHDGPSHHAFEDKAVLSLLTGIEAYWPEDKEEIPQLIKNVIKSNQPTYINLRR